MRTMIGALLLTASLPIQAHAAGPPIRLFIVSNTSGFVDPTTDSVRDLQKLFKSADDPKATKAKVVLVDAREDADLVVEIVGRETAPTGSYTRPTSPWVSASAETERRVTATLTAGEYSKTIIGTSSAPLHKWSDAAIHLRVQIERFVKDNRAKLIASR